MPVPLILLLGWFALVSNSSAERLEKPPVAATETLMADADPLAALDAAGTQDLLQWLVQHAADPAALSQDALNRAALRSLLADPRTGATILSLHNSVPGPPVSPLYAGLGPACAYVRTDSLTAENITALSRFLAGLPHEVTTLLLDLRAAQPPASLAGAAALTSLFVPDKTPLYLLAASPAAPALQSSAGNPVWTRRVWLLIDDQTPPPAGLAAHLLVKHLNALTFGTPTACILTETTDQPLGPRHIVRLPAATVLWPDGTRLTGTPLAPQIIVQPDPGSRQVLLALTDPAALTAHVTETEPRRPNEAALMSGTPPELLTLPAGSATHENVSRPDPVIRQAADLLETAAFLKLDAPEEIKRAQPGK